MRFFLSLLFFFVPFSVSAVEQCRDGVLSKTEKAACLTECEAYYTENPDARPSSLEGVCESWSEYGWSMLDKKRMLERISSCAMGDWHALLSLPDQARAYLMMVDSAGMALGNAAAEHRAFVAKCQNDPACRREIARLQMPYREKRPDGSYVVPDSVVDAQTQSEDFMTLYDRAKTHESALARSCENQLRSINDSIQRGPGFEEWNLEKLQERYRRLAKWDPACPGTLKFHYPTEAGPSAPRRDLMKELGIKGRCYSPAKYNEMVCFEVAAFIMDPLAVTGAGLFFGAKLAAKAGIRMTPRTAELVKAVGSTDLTAAAAVDNATGIERRTTDRSASINARANAGAGAQAEAAGEVSADLVSSERRTGERTTRKTGNDPRLPPRDVYLEENLTKEVTTPKENGEWLKAAEAEGTGKYHYFEVENSKMKELNDNLKDKNLVTALTNRYKDMTLKKVREIEAKNPGLKAHVYSDYKGLRVAFEGKLPDNLDDQLALAFDQTNASFAKELEELKIVRSSDEAKTWFRSASSTEAADEASGGARVARDQGTANRMMRGSSPQVQARMQKDLREAEGLRGGLETEWGSSRLMDGAAGTKIPSRETFELIRKAKTPEQLASDIQGRYKLSNFGVEDAKNLMSYAKATDAYSPSLRVLNRDVNNLDEAVLGGFSADFDGLGAGNMQATAAALAGKTSVREARIAARKGEKEITAELKHRMDLFHKAVGDIAKCSGDDCIGIAKKVMTNNDKVAILNRLAAKDETRGIRMAFVQSGVKDASHRTVISTHGESIEKALRAELKDVIPYDRTKSMTFGIDMKTQAVNEGSVDVLIGTQPGTNLTVEEGARIREALARAVKKVNEQLRLEGITSTYRSAP